MKYTIDRELFFDTVRAKFGPLSQYQVNGFENFLSRYESEYIDTSDLDTSLRQFAYILGTVWHESAQTMNAIREGANKSDPIISDAQAYSRVTNYLRRVGRGTSYATRKANGVSYYGRGPVQVTWEDNYRKMGPILGVDLLNNPDLLLQEPYGTRSVFEGMTRGTYTGRKLSQYITPHKTEYFNARDIVNGRKDKAGDIRIYAERFQSALFLNPNRPAVVLEESAPKEPDLPDPDTLASEYAGEYISKDVRPVDWKSIEPPPKKNVFDKVREWIVSKLPSPSYSTNEGNRNMEPQKKSWIITLIKPVAVALFAWLGIAIDPMILDNPSAWGIVILVGYALIGIAEKFFIRKEVKEVKEEVKANSPHGTL